MEVIKNRVELGSEHFIQTFKIGNGFTKGYCDKVKF